MYVYELYTEKVFFCSMKFAMTWRFSAYGEISVLRLVFIQKHFTLPESDFMIFHVLCRIYEKERNWPYVGWMNSDVLLNKPSKAGNNKILVEVSATQASWVNLIRCLWHASFWNTGYSDLCLWWPVSLKKEDIFKINRKTGTCFS